MGMRIIEEFEVIGVRMKSQDVATALGEATQVVKTYSQVRLSDDRSSQRVQMTGVPKIEMSRDVGNSIHLQERSRVHG